MVAFNAIQNAREAEIDSAEPCYTAETMAFTACIELWNEATGRNLDVSIMPLYHVRTCIAGERLGAAACKQMHIHATRYAHAPQSSINTVALFHTLRRSYSAPSAVPIATTAGLTTKAIGTSSKAF
jgi:hypothetical protein